MTLIQKLRTVVVMQLRSGRDESRDLEKIADDYAIEFAEWLSMFTQEFEDGDLRFWNKDKWELKSMKELLEIYKKEKML